MNLSMTLAIGLLAVASAAQAQISPDVKMPVPSAASIAASKVLTHGVVQKVDSASGMVTLKHGDITNLKMPARTMTFGVADKKLLEHVKAGDKVHFHVEMVNGDVTVTYIKPAR